MDAMYEKLADAIEKSNKTYDIPRIRAAYELAKKAHEGQMRSSGDPYISHPIEVAVRTGHGFGYHHRWAAA